MANEELLRTAKSMRDLRKALDDRPHFEEVPIATPVTLPKTERRSGIATGLKRLSVVWWGFVALCAVAMGLGLAFGDRAFNAKGLAFLVVGVPVAYGLHLLTCWIIDGFTGKPQ